MTGDDSTDDEEQNDELPNPPAGEETDRPFDDDEVRDLLRGAELLRYTPGTGKHSGNVMAVFRTPEGDGIGVTMREESDTPEDLIGETVREERPFVRGSGVTHGKAFILFEDRDRATEKITVRNTQAIGLYEVELDDEEPEVRADGGRKTDPVTPRWTLPEDHYYGRSVPGGVWHIFDDAERRTLCSIYNDGGVIRGSNRGLSSTDLPRDLCGSCVEEADYLDSDEERVVGECEDCGEAIHYGEFHVSDSPGDDDATRYCLDCSDVDPEDYPEESRGEA